MKSEWLDKEAEQIIVKYRAQEIEANMALRVYTSRLLGSNPSLVLHGGGNTSYKTIAKDLSGESNQVLCIKGSGWDLDTIEPAGLPSVKLNPLLSLEERETLSDEDMVALQRLNLLDPSAPNPSIECLLHAFLPHQFIDHTHSTAILALADQANSKDICEQVFGTSMGFVPYVKPGFELAKRAAKVFKSNPNVEGLILDKHGIVTFGDDAKSSYERMIAKVSLAEQHIKSGKTDVFQARDLPKDIAQLADIMPLIRGAIAKAEKTEKHKLQIVVSRQTPEILNFVNGQGLNEYAMRGVSTPDLSIRIKNWPLILPAPEASKIEDYGSQVYKAVDEFVARYEAYFSHCDGLDDIDRQILDPMPRLVLIPGIGLLGLGRDIKEASISADIGEVWIEAVTGAELVGEFRPASEEELFELEYWSLEQAKLAGKSYKPLAGNVAIVTGGGGAIGAATAASFANQGAHVIIADFNLEAATRTVTKIGKQALAIQCDVTDDQSIKKLFTSCIEHFGGVDILVSNAGAAFEGGIATIDESELRKSFELNFFAHQKVAQAAVSIMRKQETGGVLLFNASKQAINPGENFGAYGSAKAACLFLSRQYALECGRYGIRSNAVNADRIRSGLLNEEMISNRAKSRDLSESDYMQGNLLKREVRAEDVAEAFLHLALAESTTASVTTVDGGNIAAILR